MLQAESYQFNFPTPASLAVFVVELLLRWFIALTFITGGVYAFHRKRNLGVKLVALLASAAGAAFCFLLGLSFTPINHHRYGWSSSNPDINFWINWAVVLAIWGLSCLLFWAVRKGAKPGGEQTRSNAN